MSTVADFLPAHARQRTRGGCALICVAKPRSDLVIEGEIDAEEGVAVHPVRDYTGTVELLDDVAPDVRRPFIALPGR